MYSNVVFQTVLSGTLIYVLGQIIQMFILEKIYKYREILGKIDNRLKFYFKIIECPGNEAHPIERLQDASQELLQLSCDLESCRKQLIFRREETDKKVSEAANILIDLHFGVFGKSEERSEKNIQNIEKIRNLLNIPEFENS